MDIFKSRYLNLSRKLLQLIGLWPYETGTKNFIRISALTALIVLSTPHLISTIEHRKETDRLMSSLLIFLIVNSMAAKMLGLVIEEENFRDMIKNLADNWLIIRDKNERAILCEYSEWGRKFSILYSVYLTTVSGIMMFVSLAPKISDIINPLIEPRPNIHLLQGEFLIDRDDYFAVIFLLNAALIRLVSIILLSVDVMYIACMQHCCALYAILRHRLSKLNRVMNDNRTTEDDDFYSRLKDTIKLHQKTLSCTSTLDKTYSTGLSFILITNVCMIPLDACAILANIDNLLNVLPFAGLAGVIYAHLLVLFWPGQRIIDHGFDLWADAYNNEWYTNYVRTKKLLLIFMLRCSQPGAISAGGLLSMNFVNYSKIMKTAISYIAVAASFR